MIRTLLITAALALATACSGSSPDDAAITATETGSVVHEDARLILPLAGRTVTAAFMTLTSPGADRQITGVSYPDGRAELHLTSREDGMATMRKLDTVDLPADTPVTFERGALHVMVYELPTDLSEGDTVSMTFTITDADGENPQELDIDFPVIPLS